MEFKKGDIVTYKGDNTEYMVVEESGLCIIVKHMNFNSPYRVPKEWFIKKIVNKRNHLPHWLQDNTRK